MNESTSNTRIAKNTLFLYIRMIILMAVSLFTSRIMLAALGVEDFGIYNVVGGIVTCIAFLNGTIRTASIRYITVSLGKDTPKRINEIFSSILLVNVLLGLFLILISETIGLWFLYSKINIPENRITAASWVFHFSVATLLVSIISVPYNASIIAHERMKAFAYITIIDVFAKLGIAYLISIVKSLDSLILYAFLLFVVQLINQIIYFQYCIRHFEETKFKLFVDKSLLKEIWVFFSWAAYGSFVSVGFTQGLNILLNLFFGPVVNAARGIAVQVQNATNSFTTNFQTAVNPQLVKTFAIADFEDTRKLLSLSSRFSFYLLCVMGLPIIDNADYILNLWLEEVPNHTSAFLKLMLLICMFQSIANPIRMINQADGNIKKFQLYECTYLLLIVPASYIALQQGYSAEYVFVIQLFFEISAQFIRLHIVLPKISMSLGYYIKKVYLRIIPILIIPLCFTMVAPSYSHTFPVFCIRVIVLELILFILIITLGLLKNERMKLYNIVRLKLLQK